MCGSLAAGGGERAVCCHLVDPLPGQALDLGAGLRSARLAEDLRRLRTATARHTAAVVEELQQRLDAALRSA
ncbi:MAG TPA: hypothetical protein VFQ77_17030 [Pseudonocardiaceae bacterium]|jgi:hypothetical protein|nr:hypothetical protein [Pseudonocardiaceae bacterium]